MTGKAFAAEAAQISAQALTAWAVLLSFMNGRPDIFTVAFALTAFLLPLRHDGSNRDRATSCFGASLALASVIGFSLIMGLVGGGVRTETLLLLTATVLFSLAGGLHWIRRHEDDNGEAEAGHAASA